VKHSKSKLPGRFDPDWRTIVKFVGNHNHSLSSAAVLKHRDMSTDTHDRLVALFRQGHSASSALHCLKTDLLIAHGDMYYEVAADGRHVPSLSVVDKLFRSEFREEYGDMASADVLPAVENLLAQYSANNCRVKLGRVNSHYYVAICTPIMARVHEMVSQAAELVMADATGGLDRQRHRMYLLITPTAAGGLPLGAIITDTETEEVFTAALKTLQECLPVKSFYGKGFPAVFLTDNDLKERHALQSLFPNSRLLLCQFHMLKAVWSWLCDIRHGISRDHRQELYMAFKDMLYALNESDLNDKYDALCGNPVLEYYENCTHYFESLWEFRSDWATAYRGGLPLRGSNTTNYAEVAFRIVKDLIFDRVMAFNLAQLVDFIVTRYEAYIEKRLLDFSHGRYCKALLAGMSLDAKGITDADVHVLDASLGQYSVHSQSGDQWYTVDLARGFCECVHGRTGKVCKHASAVMLHAETNASTAFPVLCQETASTLFVVATGQSPPEGWLLPLHLTAATPALMTSNTQQPTTEAVAECSEVVTVEPVASLSSDQQEQLDNLFGRITQGLEGSPNVFVPAVTKMLQNVDKYASTETGLVSALTTFGKYSGLPLIRRKTSAAANKRHGIQIGVQPTAVGRRRQTLSGKRKQVAGRPPGSTQIPSHMVGHAYTTFGLLPSRKRKAPHSLQQCVYSNVGLGRKKQAKQ